MTPGTPKLIDVLNCPNLPSLPAVAVQLLELTGDPNVNMKDIAKLVSTDQGMSSKVLKTVNSSYYGLSKPCGSIERALGFLGLNTVKSIVLGFSLVETTANAGDGFDLNGHWRRAIMGATGARAVAKQLRLSDADEVFTAALFQDMGMLASFMVLKEDYTNLIYSVPHRKLCAAEQEALGFDHTEVGEMLGKMWKLPTELCVAIRYHHSPDKADQKYAEMVRAVALGVLAADAMCPDAPKSAISRIERQAGDWFGTKNGLNVESLLEEIAESSKTLAKMFDQDIGEIPSALSLISKAQEQGLALQLSTQREAESLARESVTDGLTKIGNRKKFDAEMTAMFDHAVSSDSPLSVLFFDADKFKLVNDTYGHAAGDVVLVELASRATEVVSSDGIVCRYGGEEFIVILPGKGVVDAAMIAERLRYTIADKPFNTSSVEGVPDELPITVSIGVSGIDAGPADRLSNSGELVEEADKGVYAAKDAGRNNVQVWGRFTAAKSESTNQPSIAEPETAGKIPVSAAGDTMLLIEDDALAATLVMSLLKRSSTTKIEWVSTGDEAKQKIEQIAASGSNPYKSILCDLELPGKHGMEILKKAKSIAGLCDIPFLVLTADESSETKQTVEALGATGCISKSEFCKNLGVWVDRLAQWGAIARKKAA
ncbi:MAG: HDOD domain-containing protein [Phycisphaerales bacterium]|nr:HDOD domain-containing protein [Phycisphaerales bacterium]